MQVTCYYDYACPYSYKAFLWLESLRAAGENLEVVWRTFSLKEANRDPASSSPLAVPNAESVSVLALALAGRPSGVGRNGNPHSALMTSGEAGETMNGRGQE